MSPVSVVVLILWAFGMGVFVGWGFWAPGRYGGHTYDYWKGWDDRYDSIHGKPGSYKGGSA